MFKKFRSLDDDIYISSTTGHTAVISRDFTPVHRDLWPQAYGAGAIAEDMQHVKDDYVAKKLEEARSTEQNEILETKEKMREILEDPTKYLDNGNKLIYRKVVSLTKKTYKQAFFNELWEQILEESGK